MEILKSLLLVVVSVVFVIILIEMAWNFLQFPPTQNEFTIKGTKDQVVAAIVQLIYQCHDQNKDKKTSVVCFYVAIESDGFINSTDIKENISPLRFNKQNLVASDIGQKNNTVIRYENEIIYVEVTSGERIRS